MTNKRNFLDKFFSRELDVRVRMFNVLAIAGIIVSFISAMASIVNSEGLVSFLVSLTAAFVAYTLMCYASKSGKYQLCYIIAIMAVFFFCFTFIFMVGGGYHGAMPFFYILAIVFTIYMLEGKQAILIAGAELIYYTGLCLLAYFFPDSVSDIDTEFYKLLEVMTGFWAVSLILGATMYQQFGMYKQQQRELEAGKEKALHLSEAKSNFLANMSHEIRTPINVMLGMNEMVLRESDSRQIREYGRNIQNAGKTLLLLINNILDVSKIEAGKLEVVEESYQTASLIEELSVIGTELAGRNGLAFWTEVDEALPSMLTGDWIHIKQVAANFLSNAAKYTKHGDVVLRVSGRPGEQEDKMFLCISVSDTGIGIKEDDIPVLFDAFTRVDMSVNHGVEGTGLGLTIARELMQLMDGCIHVESKWGKGSTFSAKIPQRIADSTPICKQKRRAAGELEKETHSFIAPDASILVVDDSKENLQVIRSLLSRTMLRVDTVNSGAKALEEAKHMRYDMIFMDYMMPEMDGMETLGQLLELPGFHTPVVALTANVISGVREKLLEAGFCRYLSKPIMWNEIESVLRELLPKELVTENKASEREAFPADLKNKLALELPPYGIRLEDGLHYLGGDMRQYGKLAQFFIENYSSAKEEIRSFSAEGGWENMKYCVHSLKSKAKAVGANDLSDTAAKLERLCAEKDNRHMEAVLPLLYYEWSRAREGLDLLNGRLEELMPETAEAHSSNLSNLEGLMKLLDHHRHPDALEALDHLIAEAQDPEITARLKEVWELVEEVEFEQAKRILSTMLGGDDNGR
ncbi:ATP-binding protein [Kineothrix alysoides]|nr:ATP-binding protein [Kineothrix alysoides]